MKLMKTLTDKQPHEESLVKALNTRVISVARYVINICNLTKQQLDELDILIKEELRKAKTHGVQASDENCIRTSNM